MSTPATESRGSGVLLHVTSLCSNFGIGDMGPAAYRWIDFLAKARQRVWQVLPVNATSARGHYSPYLPSSTLAGNPLLISPALLRDEGLLEPAEIDAARLPAEDRVDYARVSSAKEALLRQAFERYRQRGDGGEFASFQTEQSWWLEDHCMFLALGTHHGPQWTEWPVALRDREGDALEAARRDLRDEIDFEMFKQFLFDRQWRLLQQRARDTGVTIVGDLPFYTGFDCADVWLHRRLFKLDSLGRPRFIAGVPPDRFSDTGQLWHSPVFDWEEHETSGYRWWLDRVASNMTRFDRLRLDHFRGFVAHWEVPARATTAEAGEWVDGPGQRLLDALLEGHRADAFIAEDLGVITEDVRALVDRYGLPSMNVLLFAFDEDDSCYAPHNHMPNSVVYTGTHDNNTARGWFANETSREQRRRLTRYLGRHTDVHNVHWDMIRLAMMSVGRLAVLPMQDVLGLGVHARMNHPGVETGNWVWRLTPGQTSSELARRLADLTCIYGRCEA